MLKINSNQFPFSFFLSNRIKVDSLDSGALQHGGATQFDDAIYSNIIGNEYIELKETDNLISVFIPSTMDVNKQINNEQYINKSVNYLKRFYSITDNLKYYNTKGSWYSDDLNKIVYDNITIVTLQLNTLTEIDIQIFIDLANIIKRDMNQEAVSIAINNSLALI